MSGDRVLDFAQRVKKFYYARALLCEKLNAGQLSLEDNHLDLFFLAFHPSLNYHPLQNLSFDSFALASTAIDALSSLWSTLDSSSTKTGKRFVNFLLHLDIPNLYLDRVSTPFLYYVLKKQNIEVNFRQEIESRWISKTQDKQHECKYEDSTTLDLQNEGQVHQSSQDPTIEELKVIYENTTADFSIANLEDELLKFIYASLIYKFYRCSFIHTFRSSKYAALFNQGKGISVRKFSSDILPSGKIVKREEIIPQLDVGIGVLAECIRKGADVIYDLIIKNKLTSIPYDKSEELNIKVEKKDKSISFLETAKNLNLDAPPDFSVNWNKY